MLLLLGPRPAQAGAQPASWPHALTGPAAPPPSAALAVLRAARAPAPFHTAGRRGSLAVALEVHPVQIGDASAHRVELTTNCNTAFVMPPGSKCNCKTAVLEE